MDSSCCTNNSSTNNKIEFEVINLEKNSKSCGLCEKYSTAKSGNNDLIAVMSCEGACLRGEVSRRVANSLCFDEFPQNTARVCLGGAFTKDSGQRNMVRKAKRVIALEGCHIECASRMMKGVIPGLQPEVILVDKYYNFDENLFSINDATEEQLIKFSSEALENIITLVQ